MLEFIRVDNLIKAPTKLIWFRIRKDNVELIEYIQLPKNCRDEELGIAIINELNRLRDKLTLPRNGE